MYPLKVPLGKLKGYFFTNLTHIGPSTFSRMCLLLTSPFGPWREDYLAAAELSKKIMYLEIWAHQLQCNNQLQQAVASFQSL